jgi:hypothetical protein
MHRRRDSHPCAIVPSTIFHVPDKKSVARVATRTPPAQISARFVYSTISATCTSVPTTSDSSVTSERGGNRDDHRKEPAFENVSNKPTNGFLNFFDEIESYDDQAKFISGADRERRALP